MSHTRGPWRAAPRDIGGFLIEAAGVDDVMAVALVPTNRRDPFEVKANALVIAAAPALLDKCKKVVAWLDRLAEQAEQRASAAKHLPAFAEACTEDAKGYRATAADIRTAITAAEEGRP